MISAEKLSLFNIDAFRKLYNKNQNSYICNQDFFEIYDNETFIVKYIIRKQVRLFKFEKKFIGYVWYECPYEDELTNIYSIYIEDEYIKYINTDILKSLNSKHFKFDIIDSFKIKNIMAKLQFNATSKTILMKMKSEDCEFYAEPSNYKIRPFNKKQDENLRCQIQNSVFNSKNRSPLSIGDILAEEDQDYYIDGFGFFICDCNGTEIGYGQIIYTKGQYTIVNLGILEEYRGQGYGEKLVRQLIKFCHEKNITEVHIRVERDNYKAISLYNKIGFKEYNSLTTWSKTR